MAACLDGWTMDIRRLDGQLDDWTAGHQKAGPLGLLFTCQHRPRHGDPNLRVTLSVSETQTETETGTETQTQTETQTESRRLFSDRLQSSDRSGCIVSNATVGFRRFYTAQSMNLHTIEWMPGLQ